MPLRAHYERGNVVRGILPSYLLRSGWSGLVGGEGGEAGGEAFLDGGGDEVGQVAAEGGEGTLWWLESGGSRLVFRSRGWRSPPARGQDFAVGQAVFCDLCPVARKEICVNLPT
jgi:hypothetical protein